MQVLGCPERNDVKALSLNLDQGKVCGGVGSDDLGCEITVVVQRYFKLVGFLYDMVVGDDVAVRCYYDTASEARLAVNLLALLLLRLLLASWLLAKLGPEEKFKERVGISLRSLLYLR